MSTTQIPPGTPSAPPPSAGSDGADLYDASGWEIAYRQMHDVPALLIQLQDDLSRARRREALWMSVIVHLTLVILIMNSDRFVNLFPHRNVIVMSPDMAKQKDLTYLELPPDEQKLTKRPDTNIISDKNRVATSRNPQLDTKELKKILDSARPGAPGHSAPPAASTPPAPTVAQNTPPPQTQPDQQPSQSPGPPSPPNQGQAARLNLPASNPKPSFSTNMSAGAEIAQAARAAAAGRGGYGGGDDGNYGLQQGKSHQALGPAEILSDTQGVDFSPYLARLITVVRQNWYQLLPPSAFPPISKQGKLTIQFGILKDGKVAGMTLVSSSGDVALDRASWGSITASNPFPPLPSEFSGPYLLLRFTYYYNPEKSDLQ